MNKFLSRATTELLRQRGFPLIKREIDAIDILALLPEFALVFDVDYKNKNGVSWTCYDTLERGEKRILFSSDNPAECCAFCWIEFNYESYLQNRRAAPHQ